MKAIQTKYFGPTDFKGSRIKAFDLDGNSIIVSYPHELSGSDVHFKAVKAFISKFPGWGPAEKWKEGAVKDGYAWVNCER